MAAEGAIATLASLLQKRVREAVLEYGKRAHEVLTNIKNRQRLNRSEKVEGYGKIKELP